MKKIFSIALAMLIVCSMFCICVHAESTNYAASAVWQKGYCSAIETYEENGETIYKASYAEGKHDAWGSPTLPILDAVKAAIGESDTADIVIVFYIRAVGQNPDEEVTSTCRSLIRGESPIKDKATFDEKYEEALDGSDAFFVMSGVNIQKGYNSLNISNKEWTEVEIAIEGLENAQVNNDVVTGWNVCIDNIKNCAEFTALEVKNAGVYLLDEYEPAEGSNSEIANKPDKNQVANGAVCTQSPARTPEPVADDTVETVKETPSFNINTVFYIAGGVMIVASVAVVVVALVKKPKKVATAEENAEEKTE